MAVVSSFTHNGDALIPPEQVVDFVDTSTGSPNRWLWDFGDGETSNLQSPSHTYTGEAPDTFDVVLKVWLVTSSTASGMTQIPGSAMSTEKVVLGSHNPPDRIQEFNEVANFGTLSSTRKFVANMMDTHGGSTFREIRALRCQFSNTPTSDPLKVPTIRVPLVNGEAWYNRFPGGVWGTCILKRSDPGTWPGSFVTVASQGAVGIGRDIEFDLSAWRGVASWFMVTSTELAGPEDEGTNGELGFMGHSVQAYDQNIAGADDVDESTQQLIWGTPPIASFEANPVSGHDPLEVTFNNTSVLAVGLPTTWSWKKRLHGSGDSFVEFSTLKNPIETFNK